MKDFDHINNKKIIILTGDNNFYGQTRKPWVSMNVMAIKERLSHYSYEVNIYNIQDVFNKKITLENEIILYSFSQKPNVRQYIIDVLTFLNKNNTIIPSLDLLYCHENKGYQKIYKEMCGLTGLKAWYFSSLKEIDNYNIPYPIILKTITGSNGKGVFLIQNRRDLEKRLKKLSKIEFLKSFDLFRRHYFRKKTFPEYPNHNDYEDYLQYKEYITKNENFILQEFVPGLTYDYRILALEGKYFAMKRHTREGDFRASGTKIFDFTFNPEDALLNCAEKVYNHLDSPFLSMDIVFNGHEYFLIEFQASHFGVSAILKSKGYYTRIKNEWRFVKEKLNVEYEIADALDRYILKHKI
ncbi:MAG: hypothetical protein PHS99_02910 [Candidatus Marinimicrobia bacterium]|nr:hypothetical protein [Candidatus Neomarinimicrobiota bacterium]